MNKIALDLEYTFVRRVSQGETAYRVHGFYTRKTTVERRLQLTFFSPKIGYANLPCGSYFGVSRR